jgi:hypothetical protein
MRVDSGEQSSVARTNSTLPTSRAPSSDCDFTRFHKI